MSDAWKREGRAQLERLGYGPGVDVRTSHAWHFPTDFCAVCGQGLQDVMETGFACPSDLEGKLVAISHIVRGKRMAQVAEVVLSRVAVGPGVAVLAVVPDPE